MARDAAARSPFTHSRSLMTRKPEGVGWAGVREKQSVCGSERRKLGRTKEEGVGVLHA